LFFLLHAKEVLAKDMALVVVGTVIMDVIQVYIAQPKMWTCLTSTGFVEDAEEFGSGLVVVIQIKAVLFVSSGVFNSILIILMDAR
jgi:hypothetical protein